MSLDLLNLARAAHSSHGSKATSTSTRSRSSQLTDREWEIARLVVQGIGYREIGERLYISPRTVEHHVASVRRRLGSANRAEMIETLRRLLVRSTPGDGE
jgi:DNA-binding CsgD family transcriptional regulator